MSGDRTRRCRPRPNSVSALCFLGRHNDPLARRRPSSTSKVLPKAVLVGELAETAAGTRRLLKPTAVQLAGIRTIPYRLVP